MLAEPSSSLHTLPTSCIPCPLAGAGLAGSQGALVVGRAWCGPRVPRAATAALRLLRLRTTPAEALQQRVSAAPPAQWLRDRDLPQGAESPPRVYDTVDCDQVLVCVCGEGDTQAAALTKHSYLPKPCSHQNFEKKFFFGFPGPASHRSFAFLPCRQQQRRRLSPRRRSVKSGQYGVCSLSHHDSQGSQVFLDWVTGTYR